MITAFNMHRITGVRLESIDSGSALGREYYSRGIVFESLRHDGTKEEFLITLFSNNGHNLLISDSELDAILIEPIKEAA